MTKRDIHKFKKPFPLGWYVLGFVTTVIIFTAPLSMALFAAILADTHGCTLNEAGVNPCVFWGRDWGDSLFIMFGMGWYALLTVPVGIAVLIVGAIAYAIQLGLHVTDKRPLEGGKS